VRKKITTKSERAIKQAADRAKYRANILKLDEDLKSSGTTYIDKSLIRN